MIYKVLWVILTGKALFSLAQGHYTRGPSESRIDYTTKLIGKTSLLIIVLQKVPRFWQL